MGATKQMLEDSAYDYWVGANDPIGDKEWGYEPGEETAGGALSCLGSVVREASERHAEEIDEETGEVDEFAQSRWAAAIKAIKKADKYRFHSRYCTGIMPDGLQYWIIPIERDDDGEADDPSNHIDQRVLNADGTPHVGRITKRPEEGAPIRTEVRLVERARAHLRFVCDREGLDSFSDAVDWLVWEDMDRHS